MTRKATLRKVYDPMACIIKRMPLSASQQIDIGIAYHASLTALLTGHGTEQAWSTLACALNHAQILCKQGIAATYLQTIQTALDALLSSKARASEKQRWGFSGDEARGVMRACAIYDEQISRATRGQITTALEEVHRRVTEGETA